MTGFLNSHVQSAEGRAAFIYVTVWTSSSVVCHMQAAEQVDTMADCLFCGSGCPQLWPCVETWSCR